MNILRFELARDAAVSVIDHKGEMLKEATYAGGEILQLESEDQTAEFTRWMQSAGLDKRAS